MSNTTKAKKKLSFGKILLWIVAIFVALHFCTDGASSDALWKLFSPTTTRPSVTELYQPNVGITITDAEDNAGARVLSVTAGGPADIAGIRPGDTITALGYWTITSAADLMEDISTFPPGEITTVRIQRGDTRLVLRITLGEVVQDTTATPPSTSTDAPPSTSTGPLPPTSTGTPPEDLSSLPEALRNHVYLNMRNWGYCEKLTGNAVITFLFVSDPEAAWTNDAIDAVKSQLQAAASRITSDAAAYGAQVNITLQFKTSTTTQTIVDGDTGKWMDSALTAAGLPGRTGINTHLENLHGCDSAPLIFVANHGGRATATSHSSKNEFAILYQNANAFYHELSHIYGAKDFYYPAEVKALAETYLPNSLMGGSSEGDMDDFTAYLIGWTDTLSNNALAFLEETAYLTQDYLAAEKEKENYTGYVTDFQATWGTYTGYLVNGVRHGQGKWISNFGYTQEGTFLHGSLHGYGTCHYAEGHLYEGNWSNGRWEGQGTFTWAGGDKYSGNFADGERSGYGVYYYSSGSRYEGQWVDGNQQGQGTMYYTDGTVYEGQWVDGNQQGQGTMYYTDGGIYTGSWSAGKRDGQGKLTYANGNYYDGSWRDGTWNGQGTFSWASGDKYIGEFLDGKRHGYGIYYYPSGNRYEGYWANGERHGQGTMYYANGTTKSGTWNNGEFQG